VSDGRRPRRVAETIRKHVAEALGRELFDPRLAHLAVTRVEIGADLSLARVFVRSLTGSVSESERQLIEKAANRAAPALRRGLGTRLGIKKTPELAFSYDTGQDAIDRVEELLGEIARESSTRSS
jgi:ribosome-binding factor A